MDDWTVTKERTPKTGELVDIAFVVEGNFYFDGVVWRQEFIPGHGGWIDQPTHWRLKPKPPADQKDQ